MEIREYSRDGREGRDSKPQTEGSSHNLPGSATSPFEEYKRVEIKSPVKEDRVVNQNNAD